MDERRLPITVQEVRAQGLPLRQLELVCRITNPSHFEICILDAWLQIETLNGLRLAEGKLLYCQHNLVEPAIIAPGQQGFAAIVMPLSPAILQHVEDRRAGGDIVLRITSRVLVSPIQEQNGTRILGTPIEALFDERSKGYVEYKIPQSE